MKSDLLILGAAIAAALFITKRAAAPAQTSTRSTPSQRTLATTTNDDRIVFDWASGTFQSVPRYGLNPYAVNGAFSLDPFTAPIDPQIGYGF